MRASNNQRSQLRTATTQRKVEAEIPERQMNR
jgi:hypothetical protein